VAKTQQSSIDRLPEDIRTRLQELLRDPRVTQLEATAKINAILQEQGGQKLSKSAVNRYAVRMEKIGARIRQSREVAQMWIGTLGAEPQGEVGKLLNEMVRNLAFEYTTEMLDGDVPVDPKMLKNLAIAIERLERAASENVKRETEIRKKALEDAAQAAEATAKQAGVSDQTIKIIRRDVLRMAD
jgi:hypothetical protein